MYDAVHGEARIDLSGVFSDHLPVAMVVNVQISGQRASRG